MGDRWYPHVTVACVCERDGRYLMVQETLRGVTVFNQPAGHLEAGESLDEAVVRETLEETGYEFKPLALTGIYQFVAPNGETYLRFAYTGELGDAPTGQPLDPDIDCALWLSRAELEARAGELRSQVVLTCIADYEAGRRIPLETVCGLKSAS